MDVVSYLLGWYDTYSTAQSLTLQAVLSLSLSLSKVGECEKNPKFMLKDCAPSCFRCDYLDMAKRCAFDPNLPIHFAKPGDLNTMFLRILQDPQLAVYHPRAVLQPPDGPWIVVLDNFLSDDECHTLIQLGHEQGYERSTNVGAKKYDGTYEAAKQSSRTSHNAWCVNECWQDDVTQRIHDRLELLTGVDRINYEYLQLLKYEVGEFYDRHHDYIDHHLERAQGPRALTVFMYLNDVEQGGNTTFTDVNVSVTPQKGRVVIWPSILDDHPMEMDPSTHHKAEPVEAGIKYGANAWVHQRDFKTPWKEECH
jgi:prolyl 4-hydroxylase